MLSASKSKVDEDGQHLIPLLSVRKSEISPCVKSMGEDDNGVNHVSKEVVSVVERVCLFSTKTGVTNRVYNSVSL